MISTLGNEVTGTTNFNPSIVINSTTNDKNTDVKITSCTYGTVHHDHTLCGYYFLDNLQPDQLKIIDILYNIHHPNVLHSSKIISTINNTKGMIMFLPLAKRTLDDVLKYQYRTTSQTLPLLHAILDALIVLHTYRLAGVTLDSKKIVVSDSTPNLVSPVLSDFTEVVINASEGELHGDLRRFAILMLSCLENNVPREFSSQQVLSRYDELAPRISERYRTQYREVLVACFEPTMSTKQLRSYPLWNEQTHDLQKEIPRSVSQLSRCSPDRREIIKNIFHMVKITIPECTARILFVVVDLYIRYEDHVLQQGRDNFDDNLRIAAAALWMATGYVGYQPENYSLMNYCNDVGTHLEIVPDKLQTLLSELLIEIALVLYKNNGTPLCDTRYLDNIVNHRERCMNAIDLVLLYRDVGGYNQQYYQWKRAMMDEIKDDSTRPVDIRASEVL